jgi:hypothetical protein
MAWTSGNAHYCNLVAVIVYDILAGQQSEALYTLM